MIFGRLLSYPFSLTGIVVALLVVHDAAAQAKMRGAGEMPGLQLIDRNGPVLFALVRQVELKDGALIPGTVACDATGEAESWIFSYPLASVAEEPLGEEHALLSLVLQGFSLTDPDNPVARRHFDYGLTMAMQRTLALSAGSSTSVPKDRIGPSVLALMEAIYRPSAGDLAPDQVRFDQIAQDLTCGVTIKLVSADGQVAESRANISPLALALWLANYRAQDMSERLELFRQALTP